MGVISIVNGIINQFITMGAPPCMLCGCKQTIMGMSIIIHAHMQMPVSQQGFSKRVPKKKCVYIYNINYIINSLPII